jgi:hypothetical protein
MTILIETQLPFLTLNPDRYSSYRKLFKLKMIDKDLIKKYNSPQTIFKKANKI